MKKNLLSALFCGASLLSFAQPSPGFETWTGTGANEDPIGWFTGNVLVNNLFPGNVQSVFKVTSPDVHGGTYAMKIVSVDVASNPAPTQVPDPVGIAAPGAVSLFPSASIKLGFPYAARPGGLEFYFKYAPVTGDTASMFLLLTKWNGTKRDTIGGAELSTAATISTYSLATTSITYNPLVPITTNPDTAILVFSSTIARCLTCGKVGSVLFVDDFVFTAPTGINDKNISNQGVILYPNPAVDYTYISVDTEDAYAVNIYDITGKQVRSLTMQESQNGFNKKAATISTANLSNGLYSYTITDKDGNALRAGKLNIAR